MARNKDPKGSEENGAEATPVEETASAVPADVTVPIEAGAATVPVEGGTKAVKVSAIPEDLRKGNRICASCGTPEAEFLAKNQRYSLCQGVDVLCYRKGDRVILGATLEEVNAKYPDKVGKTDEKTGKPLIEAVGSPGIKAGILVRGAVSYKRKATDTAVTGTPAAVATGSANATSAG